MGSDLPYAKLLTAIFDQGYWATMSPAARALYPALLRFSDGQYKPVFPGAKTLLKLTGFKQKGTLRKARQELIDLGLIRIAAGSGRTNTTYHLLTEWARTGVLAHTPEGRNAAPPEEGSSTPWESKERRPGGRPDRRPYNQVHISINNNVPGERAAELRHLYRRFGKNEVERAISECRLASREESLVNLQKILYQDGANRGASWPEIEGYLKDQISSSSLRMIREALILSESDLFVFSAYLPEHLKALLTEVCPRIFFKDDMALAR